MTLEDTQANPAHQRLVKLSELFAKLAKVSAEHERTGREKLALEAEINELAGVPLCPTNDQPPARHVGSNTDLYVRILRENGRPMHATEITQQALARGLRLAGKVDKAPEKKVRHALHRCDEVYNLGSNVWWLTGQPEPER